MKIRHCTYFLLFCGFAFIFSGCGGTTTNLSQFKVQHPSRVAIPRSVTKVYIRADLVLDTQDKLKLKAQVLDHLAQELNRQGRFRVEVVQSLDTTKINPEKESIAIIQGEVLSGGEVDKGQFTDIATCKGGIAGRISSAGSAALTKQAVTFDSALFVCKKGNLKSKVVEGVFAQAMSLAGVQGAPPVNQVVRTYDYKNLSLFVQTNFSFTVIGATRETLAIRADAGHFGKQVILDGSYRNVAEARPNPVTNMLIRKTRTPIFPIVIREAALVHRSNPRSEFYDQPQLPAPGVRDLPSDTRKEILKELIQRSTSSFVQSVSPYTVTISAEVASGGKVDVGRLLRSGKWKLARKRIEKLPQTQRAGADWYNLGLAYEAGARATEDYEDAQRFYTEALNKEAGNSLYAMGVGRMERQLRK